MDNRLLISFDGEFWYVRRIASTTHDAIKNEMIYTCDKPIGRKFKTANEAMMKAKSAISNPKSKVWK